MQFHKQETELEKCDSVPVYPTGLVKTMPKTIQPIQNPWYTAVNTDGTPVIPAMQVPAILVYTEQDNSVTKH